MPKPAMSPSTNSAMLEGINSTSAMIGPSLSVATDMRSSRSRAPVRSSELTRTRQRIHRKARKIRPIALEPVQIGGRTLAADQRDEEFFERPRSMRAGAHLLDPPLRDEAAVGDDADMRGQPLDNFEDVRGEKDRSAAADERVQHFLDLSRGDRVDAFEGLVEKEQARRGQQCR